MRLFGAFELGIELGATDKPVSIHAAFLRYTKGEDGWLFITPECSSYKETVSYTHLTLPTTERV